MNFSDTDRFLDSLYERGKSAVDLAVYLDGKLVHRHMNGYSNLEEKTPVSENTLYRMFSMTKPVTCVALMQLYEKGLFLLTDPIAQYLPEFEHMTVQRQQPVHCGDITIRQLFTMTSGLTYNLDTEFLQKLYAEKPGTYTTREFVGAVAKEPLSFEPGAHWQYSLAHDVLAALVEVLSGERFSDYCENHIFKPLGMTDSRFHLPQSELRRDCVRYCYDTAEKRYYRMEGDTDTQHWNTYQRSVNHDSGGAGLTCSVNDYAKFACMLTALGTAENGTRILASRTLNLMRENQLTPEQMKDFSWVQFVGYGYGLGMRTLVSRAQAGSAGGLGEYGWGGAAGTYFVCDPENRLTYVYGQQASPSEEPYIQPRLRSLVYAALEY